VTTADDARRGWADDTSARLLARGLRNGGARRSIIRHLADQDCCQSAQEIFDGLRASGRPVGLASIYRILDLLASEGAVQRIELGSGLSRFEPVWPGGDHHHHLVCDDCGKVEPFADVALERALARVQEQSGYAVAAHDVVLHGSCAECHPG
jgi:Fur family ferric uptake transcriptional regulator